MRFLFILLFATPLLLLARENPFSPATESEKKSVTQQIMTAPKTKAVTKPKIHPQRQQTNGLPAKQRFQDVAVPL